MEIETNIQDLFLRPLVPSDGDALYDLVQKNRAHLTRNGDYTELVEKSREDIQAELKDASDKIQTYGLTLAGRLIGSVSLIRYEAGIYGLGYWLSAAYVGNGYMREAVRCVVSVARDKFQAREVWAGITHSNEPSIRLVTGLGFKLARNQPSHGSYKLALLSDGCTQ